jgi:HAD superfamily hydrolase (TIGR01509 family)
MIRATIFDMDGVLTDSEPLICAAATEMFRERGVNVHPDDFRPFIGTGEDRYIGGVAEKYRLTLDIPSAKRRTYEIYLRLIEQGIDAFPGAVDLVSACRKSGLLLAVASSADRIKVEANLRKIGLPWTSWNAVVTAENVRNKKPAPDIFLAAAASLNVASSDCCVVEDAPNGVAAAKSAGMRCVAVAQTFSPDQLTAADVVRPNLLKVSVADLVGASGETGCK